MSTREFVAEFTDFWRDPSPHRLPDLLHPDVVLVQPLAPVMTGIEAAQSEFRRFCHCLPGLRGEVDRWCADGTLVFIEFRLQAFGGRLQWPVVNRLHVSDGKATERVTYFDALGLLPGLLGHPSIGWRWLVTSRRLR